MDRLWTPWRYSYVTQADADPRPGVPTELAAWPGNHECVFCNLLASTEYAIEHGMAAEEAERESHIVLRGKHCFVCLNAYPYSNGHLMVLPYAHIDRLRKLTVEARYELMDLAERSERVLERLYRPHGLNFGLNLGQAAGAGVANHLHLHGLPRWTGDTNFMTTIAESRVIPEDLKMTWQRMREGFAAEQ